jgi:signal transduction histidine kinase
MMLEGGVHSDFQSVHVELDALGEWQRAAEIDRVGGTAHIGLTASIAHEVTQPLAAVVANAQACLRWLDSDTPDLDGARRSVEWIIDDGSRASEVIHRVRALARKTDIEKVAYGRCGASA